MRESKGERREKKNILLKKGRKRRGLGGARRLFSRFRKGREGSGRVLIIWCKAKAKTIHLGAKRVKGRKGCVGVCVRVSEGFSRRSADGPSDPIRSKVEEGAGIST